MPQLLVIRWRDIPAQVIVREGRTSEKRELPLRFVEAIDRAAMRSGLKDSDGYLAQWQRGEDNALADRIMQKVQASTSLAMIADAAAAALDANFDEERLHALVLNDGRDRSANSNDRTSPGRGHSA